VIEPRLFVTPRAFFFGCWNAPGHHLHDPTGNRVRDVDAGPFGMYRGVPLDSNYAPRSATCAIKIVGQTIAPGQVCWNAQGDTQDERRKIFYASVECPQGSYWLHRRDGFTMISWWDRAQGDTRPNCNSTFLLEGEHTAEVMITKLAACFPHVVMNLNLAGVEFKPLTVFFP